MSSATPTKSLSIEDRLQAIEDRLEITNLLASHSVIVDSLQFGRMAEMFTPDGVLAHGSRGSVPISKLTGADPTTMQNAAQMGLAHLSTVPYIKLGKNTAVAFSYVAVTVRDPTAESIDVPAHGSGRGHRMFLIAANRWDVVRTEGSWKLSRRELVVCDGTDAPRELQRGVLSAVVVE
jgi:SnoaL-like domain